MPTGTFTRSQYEEISKTCEDHTEEEIKKGFIGKDGKHHEYEYVGKKYMYRTHMTNEEFYLMNDKKALENCQKCSMWSRCKVAEHIIISMKCVSNKMVDELTKEINTKILNQVLTKNSQK